MGKRQIFLILALLLLTMSYPALPVSGQAIQVKNVAGRVLSRNGVQARALEVRFSSAFTSTLNSMINDPANYSATEEFPNQGGKITGATSQLPLHIDAVDSQLGGPLFVVLYISGSGSGRGKITIKPMTSSGASIAGTTLSWIIAAERYPKDPGHVDAKLQGSTDALTAQFSVAYTTDFHLGSSGKDVDRDWFGIEGSLPITQPRDVSHAMTSNADASGDVADYIQASFSRRTYYGSSNRVESVGLVTRTSGRFSGNETVINYQPYAALSNDGRSFYGAELEAGYRDGRSEWLNLTQKAPDRGNLVGRAGAVLEWAPQLGPINRDLGSGLRFFIRGRGWADSYKNNSGHSDVRPRAFVDSEFFYDFTTRYRVFLRYEGGYLPPDLSRRKSGFFVGMGTAF